MSTTTAPPRAARRTARVALLAGGLLIAGVSVAVVAPALFIPALLAAIVLIPAGAAIGLAARVVLAIRRRDAKVHVGEVKIEGQSLAAASFDTRLQRTGRNASIALLVLAVVGGGYDATIGHVMDRLGAAGYVSNNTSFSGNLLLALGWLTATPPILALAAIPVASVLVVRQIRDRQIIAGEAYALATRTGAYRTIRTSRILSDITLGLYEAAAITVIALAASGALTQHIG